jgi:hypothetical protein
MDLITNPWLTLQDDPFVFEKDRPLVEAHNARYENTDYEIRLEVVPEPFIGSPNAPLWLLNLNPGFSEGDLRHGPELIATQKKSAILEVDDFWYLDEAYASAPGHDWWSKKLGALTREYGIQRVRKNLFCVELFPYHSKKWRGNSNKLWPSQLFTLDVVKTAAKNKKKFVVMRQAKNWMKLVPELENARHTNLKNFRNCSVSRENLEDPTIIDEIFYTRV